MITMKQWGEHDDHMINHISWPASKKDIVEACNGEDVEPDVMKEIKAIPDREYESPEDLKSVLVEEEK
jgi:hypothetical protein